MKQLIAITASFLISTFLLNPFSLPAQEADSMIALPEWQQGYLDIHHINTTKGNATFIICPDGTTLLVDAGDMDVEEFNRKYYPMTANSTRLNDSSFSGGRYIAEYINKVFPKGQKPVINYALITHYHQDHYGKVRKNTRFSPDSAYRLTGITEVATLLPVTTLIDRGYDFPVDLKTYYKDGTFQNYLSFVAHRKKQSANAVQTLIPGSKSQMKLVHAPDTYPSFSVRNIKCNATLWDGKKDGTNTVFTAGELLNKDNKFEENPLSLAIKISYGDFDYYTGGDNTGIPNETGYKPDVETPMAKVIGKTDVMTLDHHGNRDANNAVFLETLFPKVVVGQTWCSDHIGQELAFRLLQQKQDNVSRDVFLTHMHEEAKVYLGPWIVNGFKHTEGHTLVRVLPDGSFHVLILQEDTTKMNITKQFGPYRAD